MKKKRVTTDDSIEAEDYPSVQSTDSRNSAMFREDWAPFHLPQPEVLAEATGIINAIARGKGLNLSSKKLRRVVLWAIDLSDAYRKLGVQRA